MSEKYEPRYAKGELLVNFKKNCPEGIPKYLKEKLGYKIIPNDESDWYIYRVGDIKKAITNFNNYNEFIEWIEKRDLKLEGRYKCQEGLEYMVRNLDGDFETNNFKKSLNEIVKYIKNFKD